MDILQLSQDTINFLKKNIESYAGFNKELASQIINLIAKINFEKINYNYSQIKILNDKKSGFLFFLISSERSIQIEITLFREEIEMYVSDDKSSIYDSYKITKRNIEKIKNNLNMWFYNDITRETHYYKNYIKKDIYKYSGDQNSKINILHKSISLNYFFKKSSKSFVKKYYSWIDNS